MKHWKTLSKKTVHTNPYWSVEEHEVTRPNGEPGKYFIAQRADFCSVVPIDEHGYIYLIYQERYPTGMAGWEIPQGMIDPGEETLAAAHRELKEETGLQATEMIELGQLEAEKGIITSMGHVYVAKQLTQGEGTDQANEGITACRPFSMEEIKSKIRTGEIHDDFTLASIFMADVHGQLA
jgi:ADP-ribose pyrophosphatase